MATQPWAGAAGPGKPRRWSRQEHQSCPPSTGRGSQKQDGQWVPLTPAEVWEAKAVLHLLPECRIPSLLKRSPHQHHYHHGQMEKQELVQTEDMRASAILK
jgi:hypothetical protein